MQQRLQQTASICGLFFYFARGMEKLLNNSFYIREDVVQIARELLGKKLVIRRDDIILSALITETEAYAGIRDRACHAYGGRKTRRNHAMYATGGSAYVYLCYGIHYMLNVVTNKANVPEAVLIRSVYPLEGFAFESIKERLKQGKGPGRVTKLLGIDLRLNGTSFVTGSMKIYDVGIVVPDEYIIQTTRIGVDYAGDDALLPYRFYIDERYFLENDLSSWK